jgi:biopolymer transport protein ExbB
MKTPSRFSSKWIHAAFAGVVVFLANPSTVFAQDEDQSFLQLYVLNGGPWMIPIGILFGAVIALSVFNGLQLTKNKYVPDDLKATLLDHMTNCRVRSAIELAASSPTFLGRMMAYSLPKIDATRPEDLGREDVEDAIAEFTNNENRGPNQWVGYYTVITQAAPMLGLLGTVIGMVGAFATLTQTGGADAPALAGDISVALLTTMSGLITAIISLFCYFFFKGKLMKYTAEAHGSASEMLDNAINAIHGDAMLAKVPEGLHAE